jgi:hypothetical protein
MLMIQARVVELTPPQTRGLSAFKPKKELSFEFHSAAAGDIAPGLK